MRRGRYSEFNSSRYRFDAVQCFQFASEQMCGETERTRLFVEHRYQIVGHYVLVGL